MAEINGAKGGKRPVERYARSDKKKATAIG
jgi:hypothetical protein